MAEIMWHRRETRRQTENTNVTPTAPEDLSLLDKNPNALLYQQLCLGHAPCLSVNFMTLSPILIIEIRRRGRSERGMDWKKLLRSITTSVDEELRLRNAYLIAENRMLRQQISGRVHLTVSDRQALAELGQQLGKKALEEMAMVAKPDTILAWHRTFAAR